MLDALVRDYSAMIRMVMEPAPSFDEVVEAITVLEATLNRR
jgi:hypothetical protein